jgi:ATP-dependent RNA helicase MSS116
MMKTSLLRQAAAARVALAVRPAQAAFRVSSTALPFSRSSPNSPAVYRPASSLLRFYSSESAAPATTDGARPGRITRFADLPQIGVHERLVASLTRGMKYETMTEVQSSTINAALAGRDVVAQAKTGTGKTLAFLVPIVQRIIDNDVALAMPRGGRARSDDIRAIVVSPTRELAEQIGVEAKKLCQGTGVVVQIAVGGTQKNMMLRKTRMEGCHLMIATPGRLHDLLSDRSAGIAAPNLAALVLDEADRMLDVGFKAELESITEFLPRRDEVPRQTLLYSATLPKNVVNIARQFINPTNFEFVQTVKSDEAPTHERVPQFIVPCRGFENIGPTLLELTRREIQKSLSDPERMPFKAIVFLPTTASVMCYSRLFRGLRTKDRSIPRVYDIHSKLPQNMRTRAAEDFRALTSGILFSSDVSARGMDFPNVTHVIQIHLPQDRDLYIHRIGRTGRAGKQGEAYLLASDLEIPGARDRLPGLPIQRCTDLETASLDVSKIHPLPAVFTDLKEAAQTVPEDILREAYTSLLGHAIKDVNRQDLVNEVNNLSKYTWGQYEPPMVSHRFAAQLGGGRVRGLRIGDVIPQRSSGGRGGGRDGGFGSFGARSGGGFRGGRESRPPPRDGFEMMERLANDGSRQRSRNRPQPSF